MRALSVNEAIDRLSELGGRMVTLLGKLSLDFEGTCITHIPKAESRDTDLAVDSFQSSIWVDFDLDSLQQREQWLHQFDARQVHVTGRLIAPDPRFGGCGHFSMWPAKMLVIAIEKAGVESE